MKPTKPKVVKKVWGQEEIIVNNRLYCGKRLTIEGSGASSMHRHLKKTETFFVVEGGLIIKLAKFGRIHIQFEGILLNPGDSLTIPRGTWHQFEPDGRRCVFYEFSTPHSDRDVERKWPSRKS